MEIVNGYKQTDIGKIPNDWYLRKIGEIAKVKGRIGFRGYTKKDIVKEGKGAITISPSNIENSRTDFSNCTYISWEKYYESPEIQILNGDILLVKTGSTVGKTAIVRNLFEPATLNPQVVVFKYVTINKIFFGYLMSFKIIQDQIKTTTVGGALPTLSQKQVASYDFPVPPTDNEQQAIAEVLSDIDENIENLEKLIAKKCMIKQGVMQKLISGSWRLSGFNGEWKTSKLKDVCSLEAGSRPRGGVTEEGDIPSLGGENIYNEDGLNLSTVKRVSKDFFKKMTKGILKEEDILINKDGANTGKVAIFINSGFDQASINEHLFIIRGNESLNNFFLYYFLCCESTHNEISKYIASSAQPGLNKKFVNNINIPYPEIKEQTYIVEILRDIDAELEKLERKLKKTQKIKQGMMYKLLTGKIRLI
jgi:type I restriction enzyme, S subunit